ncbi:MAG: hypothetical protein HYW57_01585 [Ignavibacteriales bacterium]|nr:hypothetical protein [Ignavibacteriales bacterium]
MKSPIIVLIAVVVVSLAFVVPQERFQDLLKDPKNQDEVITFISGNHGMVMKLLDKLESHEHFRTMLAERLKKYESSGDQSPYLGLETREIKALSDAEMKSYLEGGGMGFAKAAELNSYPGPRHVLDAADQLGVSNGVKQRIGVSFDKMHAEAVRLGKLIVDQEKSLDRLFASRKIEAATLIKSVVSIARLEGELRTTHLQAHLETSNLLTPKQRDSYNQIRGYSSNKR